MACQTVASIDFETWPISKDSPIPKPVCLSSYNGTDKGLKVGIEDIRVYLKELFEDDEITIVAHNMKFEATVIREYFPEFTDQLAKKARAGKLFCTKLYEQLLDNVRKKQTKRFSLADLVLQYFDEDISEDKKNPDAWRLRYNELDGVPLQDWPEEAKRYAIEDSVWAFKVYEVQTDIVMDYKESVTAEYYLGLMGYTGILVDKDRVKTLEKELTDKLIPAYLYMNSQELLRIKKFNGYNSKGHKKWKQLYKESDEELFKKQAENIHLLECTKNYSGGLKSKKIEQYLVDNVPELSKTSKGNISTKAEHLKQYLTQKPNDKLLENLLTIKQYTKIISAFVSRLLEADPEIRTEYNAVVSSGRTSSRTSKLFPSVNMQQMPREVPDVTWDIRNCYVPRPGYKICSIDYAGLELAATASQLNKVFGWSNMLDTINSGDAPVDMHSKFACRIKKCSYDEFVKNKKQKEYAKIRQLCKPINLGFPGGIGYDTMRSLLLREGIETKLEILQEFTYERDAMFARKVISAEYPGIRIKRLEVDKWALVYDELVVLKNELFGLYPDLEKFLKEHHLNYVTGEHKMVKNDFGEWEKEPMYAFEIPGFRRDYCTYTEFCNGFLMQSPSAIGAKRAMNHIIEKYYGSENVHPLAFIHDEIVFEVKDDENMYNYVDDVAEILMNEMSESLAGPRIAVEAELMDYWMKAGGFWSKTYFKDYLHSAKKVL